MSELRTNKIYPRDGLPAGASGGIIQVVQTVITNAFTQAATTSLALISGMEVTITPQSSSNKILVMATLNASVGASYGSHYLTLRRNGTTDIFIGDAAGSRNRASISLQGPLFYDFGAPDWGPGQGSITYLDSPATTSPTTYGLYQAETDGNGNILYVNRAPGDTDAIQYNRTASSITVMEISG